MPKSFLSFFCIANSRSNRGESSEPVRSPLADHIYFPDVAYKGHPFIWKYNRHNNTATTDFKLLGTEEYDKEDLYRYLSHHKADITVTETRAIINDVRLLRVKYPAISIYGKTGTAHRNAPAEKESTQVERRRSSEEIYFPSISMNGNPYLWYFYRSRNIAIWTGTLVNGTERYDHEELRSKLMAIPGITTENEEIAVTNVYDFSIRHSLKYHEEESALAEENNWANASI
ncbi:hypothetical protein B1207_13670 [Legionella quinlivanii]|uniref:Uncharacterized protein n=1 Tax=Legionella quinlivanii TaxID=45073 RepID=A0A364LG65_9GAMM|nr:hypothetical protein [Legionella quinlivanii]RAP35151.1 hypothetical protein B1207_13670 [Legionella quinlivanii]